MLGSGCFEKRILRVVFAILLSFMTACVSAQMSNAGTALQSGSSSLDLGGQPLGYPSGVISSTMLRDKLMQQQLAALGAPLVPHSFLRGADMLEPLAAKQLEAALLGDMPTIMAAARGQVLIVGLVKQTSTSIVTRGNHQIRNLAGKKIAYVDSSSAHHTLLQSLGSVGLSERDVQLVPMRIDQMPAALTRKEVDAFAAWEPAPSIALAETEGARIVFRGQSSDYFVVEKQFVERNPRAAEVLVAGFIRAIEWMRRAQANIDRAAHWVIRDGEALSGKPVTISTAQIVSITRRDILAVPSAPAIIRNPMAPVPLRLEFDFLKGLNKLPTEANWESVAAAFDNDLLLRVMRAPQKFRLYEFDYAD
jgi:NitT/TauT family transport system substrate-binding protein